MKGNLAHEAGGEPPRPAPPAGVAERVRAVHLDMVEAVLSGDGLDRVAELAARAAGGTVAIVVPHIGVACARTPDGGDATVAPGLRAHADERVAGRQPPLPAGARAAVAIGLGDEVIGIVALLGPAARPAAGTRAGRPAPAAVPGPASEFLRLAAVACLTDVAVRDARHEAEENLRASLVEELRAGAAIPRAALLRRAGRLGCDLRAGGVVVCAEPGGGRPGHLAAVMAGEHPGALTHFVAAGRRPVRLYVLLPAEAGRDGPARTLAAARRLATRLGRQGHVGVSSLCPDATRLSGAFAEAELVLDVIRQGESEEPLPAESGGSATYRLLFRVLSSHPEEVRAFYEQTVAPLVRHDAQYHTDLVGTLEAHLKHNCDAHATADAVFARGHVVEHRLERVRELTGLDPALAEDRERLSVGLKAYRIIARHLPR